jgi:hypothetical protein
MNTTGMDPISSRFRRAKGVEGGGGGGGAVCAGAAVSREGGGVMELRRARGCAGEYMEKAG